MRDDMNDKVYSKFSKRFAHVKRMGEEPLTIEM